MKTGAKAQVKKLLRAIDESSAFHLLSNNLQAFTARCEIIRNAESTLDLQYYYFHGDTTGHLIAQLLVEAANRGVFVRVLLDDIDTLDADEAIRILNAHPEIEIRIFNPFRFRGLLRYVEFIFDLSRVGHRMHNKAMMADESIAIIGGRNIGDIYFSADPELLFMDIDLLSIGAIVKNIKMSFEEYWNSQWTVSVDRLYEKPKRAYAIKRIRLYLNRYVQSVKETEFVKDLVSLQYDDEIFKLEYLGARARLFYDSPEKISYRNKPKTTPMLEGLREIVDSVESELTLISAYFVPGKNGIKWFQSLIHRGVTINVLTNSLAATDVVAVHSGYARYRKALLDIGVNLYELKPSAYALEKTKFKILAAGSQTSMHAKTIIIDNKSVFIGSPNLDPRSKDLNTEMGLLVEHEHLSAQVMEVFNEASHGSNSYHVQYEKVSETGSCKKQLIWRSSLNGKDIVYISEPQASRWRKIRCRLYRLLPADNLL